MRPGEAPLDYDTIVRLSIAAGVPKAVAERAAALEIAKRAAQPPAKRTIAHVGADRFNVPPARFKRELDTIEAAFFLPPRTKKNHTRWFGVQAPAYVRFKNAVVDAVAEVLAELQLPLPDQPYNLKAIFYVDKPGERADLFGLLQGIADALENAKVISNDYHFRRTDGSHIIFGDERPRVEVTISPIED